ncbi:MAG TPA: aldehyde dehydrogenase family protein, partial [Nitrospira sp.]|nr:aldehyde dehydrogenase family protein [Nitrospira sp.]
MQGPRPFLIGGQWRQADSTASVHDAFTGKVLAEVCQASETDAEAAIQSTVEAATPMADLPAHRRYHILHRIAGSLYDRREEFA